MNGPFWLLFAGITVYLAGGAWWCIRFVGAEMAEVLAHNEDVDRDWLHTVTWRGVKAGAVWPFGLLGEGIRYAGFAYAERVNVRLYVHDEKLVITDELAKIPARDITDTGDDAAFWCDPVCPDDCTCTDEVRAMHVASRRSEPMPHIDRSPMVRNRKVRTP